MRPAFASAVLAAALLGAAVRADAGSAAPAPSAGSPGAFQGEQLLFDVPDGWRVVQTRSFQEGEKRSRVALMAPLRPQPGAGSEQLAAMTQIHDHTPPLSYLKATVAQWGRLCGRQVVSPAQEAVESGYRSQTQHRYCERDRRDGLCRTFVTKALGGNDSLYVVNYVKAYPCAAAERFSAEEARRWDDYFSSVSLCDKRRDDCPADGKPVPRMST